MNVASSDPVLPSPADESSVNTKPPFTGCRSAVKWTARVLSLPLILTFSIVMVQAVFSGDYPGKSDMINGFFALFALLVAWRWEMVGGGLMFLGTALNACITHMQEEPWGAYIGWMLGFLFLTSGSLRIAVNPAASQRAVKTARIIRVPCAPRRSPRHRLIRPAAEAREGGQGWGC